MVKSIGLLSCFNALMTRFEITFPEEVFLDTQPLIRSVLDGFNVCIFAYGQTGSGKTFTMVISCELFYLLSGFQFIQRVILTA
jgi:hypothetical protein